jgi:hypothetical protein
MLSGPDGSWTLAAIDPPVLDPGDHHLTAEIHDDGARIEGP